MSKSKNRYMVIDGIPHILPVRVNFENVAVLDKARAELFDKFTPDMLALEKMLADRRARARSEYHAHSDLTWK